MLTPSWLLTAPTDCHRLLFCETPAALGSALSAPPCSLLVTATCQPPAHPLISGPCHRALCLPLCGSLTAPESHHHPVSTGDPSALDPHTTQLQGATPQLHRVVTPMGLLQTCCPECSSSVSTSGYSFLTRSHCPAYSITSTTAELQSHPLSHCRPVTEQTCHHVCACLGMYFCYCLEVGVGEVLTSHSLAPSSV